MSLGCKIMIFVMQNNNLKGFMWGKIAGDILWNILYPISKSSVLEFWTNWRPSCTTNPPPELQTPRTQEEGPGQWGTHSPSTFLFPSAASFDGGFAGYQWSSTIMASREGEGQIRPSNGRIMSRPYGWAHCTETLTETYTKHHYSSAKVCKHTSKRSVDWEEIFITTVIDSMFGVNYPCLLHLRAASHYNCASADCGMKWDGNAKK